MSLAEFGFVSLTPGHSSARHDWKDSNNPTTTKSKSRKVYFRMVYVQLLNRIKIYFRNRHNPNTKTSQNLTQAATGTRGTGSRKTCKRSSRTCC